MPTGSRIFDQAPALCGHRGSGRGLVEGHRENTLGSFLAAVEAGLDWVEVDARSTRDGVLVARHDPIVEDGRLVADLTARETDHLGLMRIADLLHELPPDVSVDLEVKTALGDALRPSGDTTAALVAELVARESRGRRVLVTSFDPAALTIVQAREPGLPVGLLTWMGFPLRKAIPAAVHLGAAVVAPHVRSFRLDQADAPRVEPPPSESVRVAHEAGLEVVAWCPRPAEGDQLIAAGVDCLIIDDVQATAAHYRTAAG